MREHPIIFSAPMIIALLEGRKTMTRRLVKNAPRHWKIYERAYGGCRHYLDGEKIHCPHDTGRRLWVRECFALVPTTAYAQSDGVFQTVNPEDESQAAVYAAGWDLCKPGLWRPSIHMPRWASRLTLEIKDIQVERLRDISEEDALAEGVVEFTNNWFAVPGLEKDGVSVGSYKSARHAFFALWDSINKSSGHRHYDNPTVWVISFEVVK